MVPRVVYRIAGNAGREPFLPLIVPNIPFVPARNAAFMSPDKGLAVDKLVDVELQRLRNAYVGCIEVDVVREIANVWYDRTTGIGETLRREISDQVLVPEHIGIDGLAAHIHARRTRAQRWRRHTFGHRPRLLRSGGDT